MANMAWLLASRKSPCPAIALGPSSLKSGAVICCARALPGCTQYAAMPGGTGAFAEALRVAESCAAPEAVASVWLPPQAVSRRVRKVVPSQVNRGMGVIFIVVMVKGTTAKRSASTLLARSFHTNNNHAVPPAGRQESPESQPIQP